MNAEPTSEKIQKNRQESMFLTVYFLLIPGWGLSA
mgnify:CR=1 FL=1